MLYKITSEKPTSRYESPVNECVDELQLYQASGIEAAVASSQLSESPSPEVSNVFPFA